MRISDWSSDVCSSDLAVKFYSEEGNWDLVGNNTPVFFFRDPLRFPDLNHAIKRDPRTGLRSADSNWDFWTLLPEALHQVTIVMSDRGIPKSMRHMHGFGRDRKSTRLNSSHYCAYRMPSSYRNKKHKIVLETLSDI